MRPLAVLLAFLAAPLAAQSAADSLDLFVVAGQSNAVGAGGTLALAPVPPAGSAYWAHVQRDGSVRLHEMDGTLFLSRSAWPAFAVRYHERTGRRVLLLQTAVGATSNAAAADRGNGHWSALHPGPGAEGGPDRLAEAVALLADVLRQLPSDARLRPAGVLWAQGETDASKIDERRITAEDYRTEMEATVARLRSAVGAPFGRGPVPFYLVQTGSRAGGDTDGHAAVREVQRAGAAAGLYTLACDHAQEFPALGMLVDDVHWDQGALNHVGEHMADVAAGDAPPAPPPVAAARPYPNPARPGQAVRGLPPGTRLFDVLGRHVATADLGGVLVAPAAAGVYVADGARVIVQ